MKLTGRIAIITGGGGGLGKAIAFTLAREGAIEVVSDVDLKAAEKVVSEIKNNGGEALAVKMDVSSIEEINQMVSVTLKKLGRIDILVNNAGVMRPASVEDTTEEEWERIMNVNLKGTFICSKAVMEVMKKQKYGKIVNIASASGKIGGVATGPHYSASKAGIICFTKTLARELAPYGINVNCVAPGPIDTPMFQLFSKETRESIIKRIPLGRIGEPRDVAEAVLFLVSDAAKYITGETLDVNGGFLMD